MKRDRVISGSRYSGTTALKLLVNTLGLYGHAILMILGGDSRYPSVDQVDNTMYNTLVNKTIYIS